VNVAPFQLYLSYTTDKIRLFLDASGEAQSFCNGQWLILPKVAICLANIGAEPAMSYFANGLDFYWVADQPYNVNDDADWRFVPAQVIGSKAKERTIHLFARLQDSVEYLYLGELESSDIALGPENESHGAARFALRPALPSQLWARFGGTALGNVDFKAVDRALASLRRPTTVEDRLGVLQVLVESWHGPIGPEDGYSAAELAGMPLPMPLRWWYRWAGKRENIMSGQNMLSKPEHRVGQLTVENGFLDFYTENQACYFWSTLPYGDDPPVFGREDRTDPWIQEGMTLSEHLILACMFEAVMGHSRYVAAATLEENELFEITSRLSRVNIAPWRWSGGTEFYTGKGAFLHVSGCTDKEWIFMYIGAKTKEPLQFLKPYVSSEWSYVAI